MSLDTVLVGALAALVAAGGTYVVSRRINSGTTAHADASTIFQAAEKLREEQRVEIEHLRTDVEAQRAEILSLRTEITSLRTEITSLRTEASALRTEADHLRTEAAVSKSEAALLRKKVADTEAAMSAVHREITGAQILREQP